MIVEQLAGCLTLLHGCFHIFEIVQMVPDRAKHHKYFLRLLDKHLPPNYKFAKTVNKTTVKIS